ncbi:MAG TPA: response regulator, partial [Verrucomicrobiae bacterium]|nr:response regulator [Verrucomicrobiae bacterium]
EGYEVEVAADGEAGLELVKRFRPDAVILDLMLPKITGIELMKQLRGTPDFEKLPIIVFSNTYQSNVIHEAWRAGATKCLSKANCTHRQLLDVVRTTLVGSSPSPPVPTPADATVAASPRPRTVAATSSPPSPALNEADAAFQVALRKALIESLPARLAAFSTLLQGIIKAVNETVRLRQLYELHLRIRALTGNAGTAGMVQIAQMSEALEALLQELHEKPANLNASTLRTVAMAVDCLSFLAGQAAAPPSATPPANILVVDDDALSRRAITHALEKAGLKCTSVEDPHLALQLLGGERYDLAFLDVDMPDMSGFELCAKLRALPGHEKTPVVFFVTGLNDFESRATSTMSGGNDFIAKPFLFIELAVKALVYVLRGKLASKTRPAP